MTYLPGDVIDIRPLGSALAQARTTALVTPPTLQAVRLVIQQKTPSPRISPMGRLHSSASRVALPSPSGNRTQELPPRQRLYLSSREPHSLHRIEDASVLVTKFVP